MTRRPRSRLKVPLLEACIRENINRREARQSTVTIHNRYTLFYHVHTFCYVTTTTPSYSSVKDICGGHVAEMGT
jgi:hypothetical protein